MMNDVPEGHALVFIVFSYAGEGRGRGTRRGISRFDHANLESDLEFTVQV